MAKYIYPIYMNGPIQSLIYWVGSGKQLIFNNDEIYYFSGLIQILIVTFSEQPPVYSRPKNPESPAPVQQQQPPVLQYPVYPPNVFPSTGFAYQGYNPTNAYAFPTPTTLYQPSATPQQQKQQNNVFVNSSGESQVGIGIVHEINF